MTEREYRAAEGISRSELWKIRESPEKFKWAQEHKETPTAALIFGTIVHKLLLEPKTFDSEFAIMPEVNKRTNEGKAVIDAFTRANEGKTIISRDDYEKAREMADFALKSPNVAYLLDGEHEKPYFWVDDETDELCKVRLDCLKTNGDDIVIVDYKTAMDASTEAFRKTAYNYGYDFQAAMYSEAVEKATGKIPVFVFIAQEKTAPYSVNIMVADSAFIARGREMFRELLNKYHECKVNDNWYGYLGEDGTLNDLTLPAWMKTDEEEQ